MKNFNERINIIRVISKDDNSSVYLVKDCYDNKIKIMKVLMNKKLSDSFQKEFYILSQLHHPNIIFVEDFGYIEGNKPYFIMEFIKGKNIVDFFKQNSYKKLKDILAQLLLALEFIHSHNLVYSDIKPQNILVKQEDKKIAVKLLDFGLISKKKDFTNKVSGGTLAYIAPEIIQKKIATSQSDLYSIGIVLYEILYGYNPFIDNDPNNIIQNQLNKIPKFDKLPEQSLNKYVAICQKLLQKNPKQRYNSAMEVVKALNKSPIYLFTETQRHRNLSLYYLKGDYLNFQWNEQLIENIKHNIKNNDSSINLIKGNDGTGKSTLLNALKTILQLNHYFTINYKYVQSYDDISNLLNISKLLVFSLNIPYEKFEQLKNNLNKTEQNDEKVYQIFSFYKNVLNKRTRVQEFKRTR
ncbi:MAG: hypothetical protein DRH57_03445 [Candidatus Cloacimonadota bacterium]|nr:MAG: hypothetical protein DRH57_03445 [Candidatus Cloacimonadota bacterium]